LDRASREVQVIGGADVASVDITTPDIGTAIVAVAGTLKGPAWLRAGLPSRRRSP
jgi:hypothetical protein